MGALGALPLVLVLAPDGGARPVSLPLVPPVLSGKVAEVPPRYTLRPVGGGNYEYAEDAFTAKIARDGRVSFDDHRVSNLSMKLFPYLPEPHPQGTPTLEGAVRRALGDKRRQAAQPPPRKGPLQQNEIATLAPRTERDRKWDAENPVIIVGGISGKFDLTDEFYRLLGEDPYRREKARFLAATFDVRLAMASRAHASDVASALAELPDRLVRIWGDTSQPAAARRRLICGLWAELQRGAAAAPAEGSEAAEPHRRAALAAARADNVINTFVATKLPAGGPDAYSPAELAACSEGLPGGVTFKPYSPPGR